MFNKEYEIEIERLAGLIEHRNVVKSQLLCRRIQNIGNE